ncbi:hypothetical protein GQX73_g8865 [Xylaria multiplex]|uniref:Steroid 5-alpha reductase C-terminal domain-containing protein n=1 Tax=Xylaria multiplex TaxID=323545 RepID=A0A7C8IN73_9PEZI|nr:hypothetical protein GQX73_g8865 [Xylaria multiplex]
MSDRKKYFDLIQRGEKKPTPSGTLTFIGLRLADIPLQHALLSRSAAAPASSFGVRILSSLGLPTIFTHTSTSLPSSLLLPINSLLSASPPGSASPAPDWSLLGCMTPLTNLPLTSLLLLLMSVGSAAKQIYWKVALSEDSFPASAAVAVSIYNTVVNSANALLFLALGTTSLLSRPLVSFRSPASSSASPSSVPLSTVVGTLLYVVGMGIETISERQRAEFKSRAENKGKVCKEGLWRWARHVNYLGYTLWRGGYCMVGSGWMGGILMGLWQGWDLSQRAVAVQDEYCSGRYGEQWVQFKYEVPYRIIPGVY